MFAHVHISINGKTYDIDISKSELSLLHGAIKEIMRNDFDWFSFEEMERELMKLDSIFALSDERL